MYKRPMLFVAILHNRIMMLNLCLEGISSTDCYGVDVEINNK